MAARNRRVGRYSPHCSGCANLVGIAKRHQNRNRAHYEPRQKKRCASNESQMQPGNNQQVRHTSQSERLTQTLVDTTAVADYQGPHFSIFRVSERCIDKLCDALASSLERSSREPFAMPDYGDRRRRTGPGGRCNYRCGDSLPHQPRLIVEFILVAVVPRKSDFARKSQLIAYAKGPSAQRGYTYETGCGHRRRGGKHAILYVDV